MTKLKSYLIYSLFLFLYLILPANIYAKNIFGLHLTQTSDIDQASKIINSSNGDWGWATITITIDQLHQNTWQDFFDKCRQNHIIPLVRLATHLQDQNWRKPTNSDIDQFASFLNSLNWPTRTQHIILFNEVNRSDEWAGLANPQEYTDIVLYASQKFRQINPNFFIITAGLDLSAPQATPQYISADTYYQQILDYQPNFFEYIDAIGSHSYPNPGFVGKPNQSGRFSIKGYQWEVDYLKSLGIKKDLPIFITETGWPHRQGVIGNNNYYTTTTAAHFLIQSINTWSQDDKIHAITPFIFNYPHQPFDHFSWLDKQQNLYPAYKSIVDMPKSKNTPQQINKFEVVKAKLPIIILPNHLYQANIYIKNTGQSIWSKSEHSFCLLPQSTQNISLSQICTSQDIQTLPGQTQQITFVFTLHQQPETDKTFIGWQGIEESFEITPIIQKTPFFRPKTNILQKIKVFFQGLSKIRL